MALSKNSNSGNSTLSTATSEVLPANGGRVGLALTNTDASIVMSVSFGEDAVATEGIVLGGGDTVVLDNVVPTQAVNAIAASGTPVLAYTEFLA